MSCVLGVMLVSLQHQQIMEKSRKQVQALDAAIEKVSNHLQLCWYGLLL